MSRQLDVVVVCDGCGSVIESGGIVTERLLAFDVCVDTCLICESSLPIGGPERAAVLRGIAARASRRAHEHVEQSGVSDVSDYGQVRFATTDDDEPAQKSANVVVDLDRWSMEAMRACQWRKS